MEYKEEVIKKYKLFLTAKKLIIALGTTAVVSLTLFFILQRYNLKAVSMVFLTLSILSLIIYAIFWAAIKPMKNHILDLIKEYEKK